jgi:hypothetical protein
MNGAVEGVEAKGTTQATASRAGDRPAALLPVEPTPRRHAMSSFSLYLVGIIVLIGGLAYVAWLMHVPLQWIGAGVIVVFGLGILGAVKHTQRRDPPK